jgi:hypothetical protein
MVGVASMFKCDYTSAGPMIVLPTGIETIGKEH